MYRYQAELLRDGRLSVPVDQFRFHRPWLSDLHEGRLVVPFTLPWVAVLAATGVLFGSPVVALGLSAAALTTGTYHLTHALLGRRGTALAAAVLVALSPFVLFQSGTYLNYVFALAVEVFAAWALIRGVQGSSVDPDENAGRGRHLRPPAWFMISGLLWATAAWCRPLDGILVGLPLAVWALHQLVRAQTATTVGAEDRLRHLWPPVGWLVAGASPVAAGVLVANRWSTGEALVFPVTAQSGGAARMGWGPRGLFRNELIENFTPSRAISALAHNAAAFPTWLVGSYLAVALAMYGAWCLRRREPAAAGLLLAFALVCPVGYLAWFASALTVPGAYTGIGPHYYLPSVVPLAVLAAVGGQDLWARRASLVAAGAVLATLATLAFVQPKVQNRLHGAAYDARVVRTVEEAMATRGDRSALVVLPAAEGVDGIMRYLDHFANRPDLTGPVIYALDRGPEIFDLLGDHPDRVWFRVTLESRPGGDLATPDAVVQRIGVTSGSTVSVRTSIVSTTRDPIVAATIELGDQIATVELDDRAVLGRRYEVAWRLKAGGVVEVSRGGGFRRVDLRLDSAGEIGLGVATGEDRSLLTASNPGRAVHTFPYRRDELGRTIEASTATTESVAFGGPEGSRLPIDVSDRVTVSFDGP